MDVLNLSRIILELLNTVSKVFVDMTYGLKM